MKTVLRLSMFALKLIFYLFRGPTVVSFFKELVLQTKIAWAILSGKQILNVVLIKPSKYDDETGFVLQDFRGVLPSNTLATIYSLIKEVSDNLRLGAKVKIVIRVYDEAVQVVRPRRIASGCQLFPAKTLVMLVGVQTNQFVRASDLALAFQKKGLQTIVGGFHVSGDLAKFPQDGQEINNRVFKKLGLKNLVESGVSLFAGEAEGRMLSLLQDFMTGRLKPVYNFLSEPPDLTGETVPLPILGIGKRFALSHMGTIDSCRGCPFDCSFCTIKTVQGKKIRARDVQGFKDAIRQNWRKGIRAYFFTSDNLARDPLWEPRFDALIAMKDNEGIAINFIMQVDALCYLIPNFVEKADKAGCTHAFIGIESVSMENLEAARKKHNQKADYRQLNAAFRPWGIAVHYGYMLGFPNDTKESIKRDVQTLLELSPDLVSFFIVIPLPGSDDHLKMVQNGEWMDPDLNAYDSFTRPVTKHPRMTQEEWLSAYQEAWQTFYSVENMVRILKRTERRFYWRAFWNLIWYKYAIEVARRHPMISGFVRVYDRKSRRDIFPRMGWLQFRFYTFRETFKTWKRTIKLMLDLKEVWLQTRERSAYEQKVISQAARLHPGDWFAVKRQELKKIHQSLGGKVPGWFSLTSQRIALRSTRTDLEAHWRLVLNQLGRGKFWVLLRWKSIRAFYEESILSWHFLRTLLNSWKER